MFNVLINKYSRTDNSRKERWLGDPCFDFKMSNVHERQQLCSENSPISLNKWFNNLLVEPR